MAVYGQPKMLGVWFDTLRSYPPEIIAAMELVIVDDAGIPAAEIPQDIQDLLPCKLFRVKVDIPWNQPGARNLALDHIDTKLILFVDPDMVFPPEAMERMVEAGEGLELKHVIRYQLKHKGSGLTDSTSPNTWFLHVEDFLYVQGYDEDFCGAKGWSDVQLLDIMKALYKIRHDPTLVADFYSLHQVSDSQVFSLDRSYEKNTKLRSRKARLAGLMGGWAKFSQAPRMKLRFDWDRLL